MKKRADRKKSTAALVTALSMLFNILPSMQITGAAAFTENFESGNADAFIRNQNGGVTFTQTANNRYMKISPLADGITAFARYPLDFEEGVPVELSYKFRLNDYVVDGHTVASLTNGGLPSISVETYNGGIAYINSENEYVTVVSSCAANKWYELQIVADYSRSVFSLYIDGRECAYEVKNKNGAKTAECVTFAAKNAPGIAIDDFSANSVRLAESVALSGENTVRLARQTAGQAEFAAVVTDSAGAAISGATCSVFISPANAGITLSQDGNRVTAHIPAEAEEGEYTLRADYEGKEAVLRFNLERYAPQIAEIKISGPARIAYLDEVASYSYSAAAFDQNGNEIPGCSFVYSLEDGAPAGIACDGAAGTVTVSAPLPKDTRIKIIAEPVDGTNIIGTKNIVLQERETYEADAMRFQTLLDYVDRVREVGRDPWNGTPLLALAIDRYTMEPATWRADYKTYVPSNLACQTNWFRTMDALYNLTGDEQYRKEVIDTYKFYIDNYKMDNGFFPWGGHMYIDMQDLSVVGEIRIELKGTSPYLDPYWELDPEGCRRHMISFWEGGITSWSRLVFNRHIDPYHRYSEANWNNYKNLINEIPVEEYGGKWTMTGDIPFRSPANDMVYMALELHEKTGDIAGLYWSYALLEKYWACADPDTKISVSTYTSRHGMPNNKDPMTELEPIGAWWLNPVTPQDLIWGMYGDRFQIQFADDLLAQGYVTERQAYGTDENGEYNPTLIRCIDPYYIGNSPNDIGNTYVDIELGLNYGADTEKGHRILDYHLSSMASFAEHSYDWDRDVYKPILGDGTSLEGFQLNRTGYWGTKGAILEASQMSAASWLSLIKTYIKCNHLTEFSEQLETIWRQAANHGKMQDMGDLGFAVPGDSVKVNLSTDADDPQYIIGLCWLYEETGEIQYLDLARRIADNIIKTSMVSGLFSHNTDSHYISLANKVGDYPYAFALLEATIRGEAESVPEYFPGTENCDDNGYMEKTNEYKTEVNSNDMWYRYAVDKVKITDIILPAEEITMKVGEEKYLEFTVEPDDAAASGCNIASSDPACVAFDYEDKLMRAIKPGTAEIDIVVKGNRLIKRTLRVNVVNEEE